ncbi:MAG TPA: acyl-ACP--UDP-N-acetylglucosamine O-acyltransferase [Verrucomicrobiota bacterium]|nr:acyl-ACP--UDP-N-acetylglucosamine O-acyltransferase [Verrucomicrobiota bacterium]HNU51050.1 acyl-ACP--UDP-N-acetylglucosamine O-acyltransferase [Verrucomicrobiota bacterium]
MIHPTAILDPRAEVDSTATVGPYAVIDAGVVVGPHCVLGPQVHLTGRTRLGSHNRVHAGCVLGDAPQDLHYRDEPTELVVGDHNTFREHVTVHRANREGDETRIGSHVLLMAGSHVAHNCKVADRVILTNGALLAGHVTVQERAIISGNCLVHQFVRVGTLALMQGGSAISKDLPPYTIAWGANGLCGLNVVGLRRAGYTAEQRTELKRLYRLLFRDGLRPSEALDRARRDFTTPEAMVLIEFVASARRGLCADRRAPGSES